MTERAIPEGDVQEMVDGLLRIILRMAPYTGFGRIDTSETVETTLRKIYKFLDERDKEEMKG